MSQIAKPCLAIYNGTVMGGGTALGIHTKNRVATETTIYSMPESRVGLFCDVAAGHILSRVRNNIGIYLGVFGVRVGGVDMVKLGLADYFVSNKSISKMLNDIR